MAWFLDATNFKWTNVHHVLDTSLFPPTKWGGDMGMVNIHTSLHLSICACVPPAGGKVIPQFTSNMPCTLIRWVFRNSLIWGHFGPISALWWLKNGWIWWGFFLPLSGILITQSTSDTLYTLDRWNLRNDWILGMFANFSPLVAAKWLKLIVFGLYMEYWSLVIFQTWCTHWLGESSEIISFWPCWPNFQPQAWLCILWCLVWNKW